MAGGGGREEGGADAGFLEVAIDLIGGLVLELDRIAAGGGRDGAAQGEREFQEIGGDLERNFEDGSERQVFRDDALGGDAAQQLRLEHDGGVLDAVEREFVAVVGEADAEVEAGLLIG